MSIEKEDKTYITTVEKIDGIRTYKYKNGETLYCIAYGEKIHKLFPINPEDSVALINAIHDNPNAITQTGFDILVERMGSPEAVLDYYLKNRSCVIAEKYELYPNPDVAKSWGYGRGDYFVAGMTGVGEDGKPVAKDYSDYIAPAPMPAPMKVLEKDEDSSEMGQ